MLLAVAGIVVATLTLRAAPAPRSTDAPDDAFSAERAQAHVEALAGEPHPIGSQANRAALEYLQGALAELDVETEVQRTTGASQRYGAAGPVANLVGRLPGQQDTGAVLLMAHYDSAPSSPGAADDAAGVAALLETVRALQASGPRSNDVVVLFTDGEEAGLLGAEAFAAQHPWMDDVAFAVNFEARGARGPSTLIETHRGNAGTVRAFAPVLPRPHAHSLNAEIYRQLPNDTDFTVLRDAGVPGLNYAFFRDAAIYHTPLDTPGRLDASSLQHHGETALAVARRATSLDLDATRLAGDEDRVYADVAGFRLLHHPASWALPLAAVTLLAWLLLTLTARRQGVVRLRSLGGGLVVVALTVAAAWGAGTGLWTWVPDLEPALAGAGLAAPYTATGSLVVLALLACLAVLVVAGLGRWVFGWAALSLAALLMHALLGLAASLYLPGASYLFLWTTLPLLTAVSVVLAAGRPREVRPTGPASALLLLGALPGLLLWPAALADGAFALGPGQAGVVAAAVALGATLLLPLLDALFGRRPVLAPLLLLLAAVGAFGWTLERAPYGPDRPRPTNAFYVTSPQDEVAWFVRASSEPDAWTRAFLDGEAAGDADATVASLLPDVPDWPSAPAPLADLPAPTLTLDGEDTQGGTRRVELSLTSNRGAPRMILYLRADGGIADLGVNGRGVPEPSRTDGWTRVNVPGAGPEPVTASFGVDAGAAVDALLVDESRDLLEIDALNVPPRPADLMAAPAGTSDAVLVSTASRFEAVE